MACPPGGCSSGSTTLPLGDPVALDGAGAASSPTSTLAAGTHKVVATYLPESPYEGSIGESTEVVDRAPALVTVESIPNPSLPGEEVTITASVEVVPPGAGTPTGLVRFSADGSSLGPAVPLLAGEASIQTDALATGTHEIVASYDGDDEIAAAAGTAAQAVGAAATGVTLSSSARPAVFGSPPTLTARLRSAGGPPTGAVDFSTADGTVLCAGVEPEPDGPDSVAECTPAPESLPAGDWTIRADYESDSPDFADSYGTLLQPVVPAPTGIAVEAQPASAIFGQSLSLHADVTGSGDPSGSVRFLVDGAAAGDPLTLGVDGATLSWPPPGGALPAGAHVIEARYGGDANNAASRAMAIAAITPALTTTTLTASANPAAAGSSVSWRAAVAIAGPGPPRATGTVRFRVDGAAHGAPVALVDGAATSAPLAGLAAGTHDVQATFSSGPGNLVPSRATLLQQIVAAPAPPPNPPTPPPNPPSPPRCRAPLLALTQLEARRGSVVVSGIALPDYAHRRATVIGDDQRVGRGSIDAEGRFTARVARPRGRLWHRVRYRVKVGRVSTPEAPLRRSLNLVARRSAGPGALRVTLALRGEHAGQLVLQRKAGCKPRNWTRVQSLRAARDGGITARLARPRAGERPSLYRVRDARRPGIASLPILVSPRG